jgi:eukaryotic-like serine/threonine-protein kinase
VSSGKDYLGNYRLIRLIRAGQVCNIWEALKDGETERVAIKVLLAAHAKKKDEIEQLRNEGRVGAGMEHPNVIRIFEFIEHAGLAFLVMQLFNARNLKQELRENPETLAMNIPLVIDQCVDALQYVNEKGWVHCDVKPDNFLVNEQGTIKLIDFSIARPIRQRRGFLGLRGKNIQGTRSYMAPEQIRGKSLDARTDVYGFGCVAFELLSGRPPYSGTNPNELLEKHLRAPVPGLQALNKHVTEDFAALVGRMLSKEPDKRPAGFGDVKKEMKRIKIFRAGKEPIIGKAPTV